MNEIYQHIPMIMGKTTILPILTITQLIRVKLARSFFVLINRVQLFHVIVRILAVFETVEFAVDALFHVLAHLSADVYVFASLVHLVVVVYALFVVVVFV